MLANTPLRPLVYLSGHIGEQWPVLLDFTSGATWLEFELASQLRARPVGERKAKLVSLAGDDIPAVLSSVSSLRLGQMFIEYPLVYVRMATGSLGAMNRDVSEGPVQAVIGWDILKKFDQIQFLYSREQVLLTTGRVRAESGGVGGYSIIGERHRMLCCSRLGKRAGGRYPD